MEEKGKNRGSASRDTRALHSANHMMKTMKPETSRHA